MQRAWPAWHHAAYLKIWFERNADVGYIKIRGTNECSPGSAQTDWCRKSFSIQGVTVLSVASRHVTVTCLCRIIYVLILCHAIY